MHQRLRTLEQLAIGQRGVIRHIDCDRRTGCRLMEMGLLPGTPIDMVRRAPEARNPLLHLQAHQAACHARFLLAGQRILAHEIWLGEFINTQTGPI